MVGTNNIVISALDIFEKTVLQYPSKTVIQDINGKLTYSELMFYSRVMAHNLSVRLSCHGDADKDIKKNIPIVIFIDKGCECLTAMLAVLYSGNCYVPMDVKTPASRLNSILSTLGSKLIIATKESVKALDNAEFDKTILLYEDLAATAAPGQIDVHLARIRAGIVDTDLMYVLFTSGSTGAPKGVAITHRSVVDYIKAFTAEVPIAVDDIVGNQVPFYVDMSLKDIYMSIAVGATICVIPQKYFMTPKKVLKYINDNKVTMLMWVPTAYSIIAQFDGLSKICPESLRKFLFSGEGMPISVYRYWFRSFPEAVWIQQYGPTEITGACTSFLIDREYGEGETIPIGKPFPNTGILLLDENNNVIPATEAEIPGEICVYGSCLAAGYYNDPEKTEKAFVQNPLVKAYSSKMYRTGDLAKWNESGNLVFISRKDYQIKHGGRRIELGEIEAVVDTIPQVKSSCCIHDSEKDVIVLLYTGNISEKELREIIRNKVPQYMVPGRYIVMNELPRLSNGKLDRKGMKELACQKS